MRRKIFLMLAICLSAFVFSTTASAQQKFTAALNGVQENPPVNTPGRGSCVLTLAAGEASISMTCTFSGMSANTTAAHIHTGVVGVNGPVLLSLTGVGGTSGTLTLPTTTVSLAQVAALRSKGWYVNVHTSTNPGGEIRGQLKISSTVFDFDGDGRTDFRVLRPTDNGFYVLNSKSGNITFNSFAGTGTASSVSDDYDGDGRGDLLSFFIVGGDRVWRILLTGSNTVREFTFGTSATTDQVLPADYDGDGKTDPIIFRRTTGIWYILRSTDNQIETVAYGAANDIGAIGDFDKDGRTDLTVVRGGTNFLNWFTRRSSDGQTQVVGFGGAFAPAGETIFAAAQVDFDGDGAQDYMTVRDSNGATATGGTFTVHIRRSSDGSIFSLPWGVDTDALRFGDYDGDGKTDIVARRTEGGVYNWYIYQTSTGSTRVVSFGGTGDLRGLDFDEERDFVVEVF
jgi:hypothetical protein